MFEVFFTHVKRIILLTKEEEETIKLSFAFKKFRKKQYLLQEGDVCKYMTFVEKGMLRSYNVDDKGDEHMMQFAWEGWWISDANSLWTGEPANFNIDVIEDAEVLTITAADFEELTVKVPKMERYFRILFQKNIIAKEKRLMHSISHSAVDRYVKLSASDPEIIKRVPQNLIASYLGIAPETLSRIKKTLSN